MTHVTPDDFDNDDYGDKSGCETCDLRGNRDGEVYVAPGATNTVLGTGIDANVEV